MDLTDPLPVDEAPDRMTPRRRRRFTPFALMVGLIGSAVMSSGAVGTYAAFTAGIKNSADVVGTGDLYMQETDSGGPSSQECTSFDGPGNVLTCSKFNKYGGGALQPGTGTSTSTIRIYNLGTLAPVSFSLTPGACSVTSNPLGTAGNVCDRLLITAMCSRTTNGSAAGSSSLFGSGATLTSIASTAVDLKASRSCTPASTTWGGNSWTQFTFTVSLDPAAGTEVQGQVAKQQLVWQFGT